MRSLAWLGAAAAAATVAASLPAVAASDGRMIRGGAPVAQMRLNPPSAMPVRPGPGTVRPLPPAGGWGPGGWQGGPRPPMPGANVPPPPVPPVAGGWQGGPRPGRPGNWQGGPRPGQPGQWYGGNWNGPRPGGWAGGNWGGGRPGWNGSYNRPFRGGRIPSYFITPSFFIGNWSTWGLTAPGYGQNWVRYYDDAVLIDRDGGILDARYGLDWDRYDRGRVPDYVGDVDDGYDYDDRGPPPYDHGRYHDEAVTWRDGNVRVVQAAPGSTVVIHSGPSVVTTTTTTTYVKETRRPAKVWKKRAWKPAAKCRCK